MRFSIVLLVLFFQIALFNKANGNQLPVKSCYVTAKAATLKKYAEQEKRVEIKQTNISIEYATKRSQFSILNDSFLFRATAKYFSPGYNCATYFPGTSIGRLILFPKHSFW
ncbi:MAG: hypothetical protein QM791_04910 [Ferruginibacter sp.]